MIFEHLFWFLMTVACVVWYGTITVYVAIRGYSDIRRMLRELRKRNQTAE